MHRGCWLHPHQDEWFSQVPDGKKAQLYEMDMNRKKQEEERLQKVKATDSKNSGDGDKEQSSTGSGNKTSKMLSARAAKLRDQV